MAQAVIWLKESLGDINNIAEYIIHVLGVIHGKRLLESVERFNHTA